MRALTPIFLVGSMAFIYLTFLRFQLLDGILVAVVSAIGFGMLALYLRSGRTEPVSGRYLTVSLLPWLAAGFFLGNGALDVSPEVRHRTRILKTYYPRRSMRDRLTVQSWRSGRENEIIYVYSDRFFYPGDSVTIAVKPGAFGFPWIVSVSR